MSDTGVTRPYPEARGPHLPDALTRVAPLAYVFAAVALFVAWRGWEDAGADGRQIGLDTVARILVPGVAIPLLGVALIARHRDAQRTHRLLLFGIALLSVLEVFDTFQVAIREFLRGSEPFIDAPSPGDIALFVFGGLLMTFGLLYVGAGLADARGPERARVERPLTIWLVALAVIAIALSLYPLTVMTQGGVVPGLIVELVVTLVIGGLVTLCWTYVAAITLGGWLASAQPRTAWVVAGVASAVLFVTRLIGVVASAFATEALAPLFFATIYASLGGWVLLLVAFAMGLPGSPVATTTGDEPLTTADPPAARPPGSGAG